MKAFFIFICLLTFSQFTLGQEQDSLIIDLSDIELMEDTTEFADGCVFQLEPIPQFPGGYDSLKSFVRQNLNWNQGKKNVVGRSFVEFIVNTDGSVTDVKIIKGLCHTCDKAAVEAVKRLPKFTPATNRNGQSIKVKMVIPIQFDL